MSKVYSLAKIKKARAAYATRGSVISRVEAGPRFELTPVISLVRPRIVFTKHPCVTTPHETEERPHEAQIRICALMPRPENIPRTTSEHCGIIACPHILSTPYHNPKNEIEIRANMSEDALPSQSNPPLA